MFLTNNQSGIALCFISLPSADIVSLHEREDTPEPFPDAHECCFPGLLSTKSHLHTFGADKCLLEGQVLTQKKTTLGRI